MIQNYYYTKDLCGGGEAVHSKLNVKKILFCVFLVFCSMPSFSQTLKVGADFSGAFAAGDAANYFGGILGGGARAEYEFSAKFGLCSFVDFYAAVSKESDVYNAWTLDFLLGGFYRVDFGNSGFSVQPALSAGLCLENAKVNGGSISSFPYTDFVLKNELSFRYSNPKVAEGKIEFALTPFVILIPQKGALAVYGGASLGLLYRFNLGGGKK